MNQRIYLPQISFRARVRPDQIRRIFESMIAFLEEGDTVVIPGFGTFRRVWHPQEERLFPPTGETLQVPARYKLKFAPSTKLHAQWKGKLRG